MAPSDPKTDQPISEQYVPFEKRESQNLNWKPFAWEMVKLIVITKVSALVGGIIGKEMAKREVKLLGMEVNGFKGSALLGTAGGLFEGYHHWRKTKKQQLDVGAISSDLRTAIDPAQLQREAEKEQAVIEGLQQLQAKRGSYTADISAGRDAAAQSNER